jgi:hypothetical protein
MYYYYYYYHYHYYHPIHAMTTSKAKYSFLNPAPIPVTARSRAWVCGRSLAGIVGSNPAGGTDVCLLSVVYCQVEVSATG